MCSLGKLMLTDSCLFCADNMLEFLTEAERQYVVKYELDSLNVEKDQHIPGLPLSKGLLQARGGISKCVCVYPAVGYIQFSLTSYLY